MSDLEDIEFVLNNAGIDHYKFYNSLNYSISIEDQVVLSFDDAEDSLVEVVFGNHIYKTTKSDKKIAVDPFGIELIKNLGSQSDD